MSTESPALRRVRGLLDKANAAGATPEEAEALTAKAMELMAKHGVSEEMLATSRPQADKVSKLRVDLGNPYSREKCNLLLHIGTAFPTRTVQHTYGATVTYATVFGFESDLEKTELLYTLLLVQALRGASTRRPSGYYTPTASETTAYRKDWFAGFAHAVGERLRDIYTQARTDYDREHGSSSALVVADRKALVDRSFNDQFGHLKNAPRHARRAGAGVHDGMAAGRRADLGGQKLGGAARRVLR